ncbi:mating-type alpha-pheromone receptor PreB [Cordyceps fumosorosea ARSEF 2679]|uniref:Mating-type alpha-pheromone receptor PreB n=1 Tax=Cordyceps fumosorosea (strain ARSEF 2679) TaxID=1081104 RepID=A0A167XIR1_CORFA|nr:mating-type alpha-pheromone receptor PreB [Cordyceps fumosorosea ARSEF 2679]OAA65021.1 mating-type alpha-pheromone receptor PreB [Cordyceps fumosorosea ARSEF 2679]
MESPPQEVVDPSFDRFAGNVTFFLADHKTTASVPMHTLNAYYDESISIVMNYGAQLGACLIMLLVVLALTPTAKLFRPASVLHLLGLLISVIRCGLLFSYYVAPFSHFYQIWAGDFSAVPRRYWDASLAANTLALPLVVVMQAALVNQAWTMVAFWPQRYKYAACALSGVIVLLTVGFRLAYTIVQNHAIITADPAVWFFWGVQWTVAMGAVSIFWFCAVFNVKLVSHLIKNRGILPSTTLINPMEILIMTNGTLMVIPSVFAGLEWAKFTNFEAGSLTLTAVIIILPLGTLAAQRISAKGSQSYLAGNNHNHNHRKHQTQTRSDFRSAGTASTLHTKPSSTVTFSTTRGGNGAPVTPQMSAGSRTDDVSLLIDRRPERMDPIDLELGRIDAAFEGHHEEDGDEVTSSCARSADQRGRMQRDDFVL